MPLLLRGNVVKLLTARFKIPLFAEDHAPLLEPTNLRTGTPTHLLIQLVDGFVVGVDNRYRRHGVRDLVARASAPDERGADRRNEEAEYRYA